MGVCTVYPPYGNTGGYTLLKKLPFKIWIDDPSPNTFRQRTVRLTVVLILKEYETTILIQNCNIRLKILTALRFQTAKTDFGLLLCNSFHTVPTFFIQNSKNGKYQYISVCKKNGPSVFVRFHSRMMNILKRFFLWYYLRFFSFHVPFWILIFNLFICTLCIWIK